MFLVPGSDLDMHRGSEMSTAWQLGVPANNIPRSDMVLICMRSIVQRIFRLFVFQNVTLIILQHSSAYGSKHINHRFMMNIEPNQINPNQPKTITTVSTLLYSATMNPSPSLQSLPNLSGRVAGALSLFLSVE